MRTQPGLTVLAPADFHQARSALLETIDLPGPIYFRLGKDESATVPGLDGRFDLGRIQQIGGGGDIAILATGPITQEASRAVGLLAARGMEATLLVVSCLSPPPTEYLVAALTGKRLAITLELHYLTGGLGSLVSEVVAEYDLPVRVVRRGVESVPRAPGSEAFLNELHGLTAAAVVATATGVVEEPLRSVVTERSGT